VALLAWRERPNLRSLFDPLGVLVFAVVAFTWFGILVAQDPDRLNYFLGHEVYDRVFTAKHDRNSQWYGGLEIYLPVFLVGALPWWALSVAAAGGPRSAWAALRSRLRSRDRTWLLLAAWFVLPLAVFMLARSRLQLYVLPLFIPLSIMTARSLSSWQWLTGRRLTWIGTATAIALLAIKGTLAYWPSDRDAREMARAIRQIVDPHGIEEIAFVDMRPFYGLNLYLDVRIEGVEIGTRQYQYSKFVAEENLCAELSGQENKVFALKERRSAEFQDDVRRCSDLSSHRIGDFTADGNTIAMFAVRPSGG
jgi:hypothetical protein